MIEIHNLTKDFGRSKGVFDVSFNIKEGEVFGFLGPNGAGKTTTIRHLMGFLNAGAGSCSINGLDCRKNSAEIMKTVGYLPGEPALFDSMTGLQFFNFIAKMRQKTDMSLCQQLIDRFELDAVTKIRKMSKGMKQKVAIVTAFMNNPDILILDEPTSGLDPLMQVEFDKMISEQKKLGKTILMSSHNFEEVEKNCDIIGIIRQGKMVCVEDIHSLLSKKKKNYTLVFASKSEAAKFISDKKFEIGTIAFPSVEVRQIDDFNALIRELQTFNIIEIQSETYTLENLFMQYYGGTN
ncbi:MAG TPA: ABC transporter ATP-binding protein [Bacteroidales bacterium]|nr:ABC transporter ATP-binding protein [Bacteroidales bacterium]